MQTFLRRFGAPVPAGTVSARSAPAESGLVSSRDIPLHLAYYRYLRATPEQKAHRMTELRRELEHRETVDRLFSGLRTQVAGERAHLVGMAPRSFACHRAVNEYISAKCGAFTDYSMKHHSTVVDLCEMENGMPARILHMVDQLC